MSLLGFLLGRPLATNEQEEEKVGVLTGVPAMGLDGLASSAYGPEAALTILVPLGAAGLVYAGPVIAVILVVLGILYFSYRQTIEAYPSNGGSYTVARENLGTGAGLLAAAALILDYVLNVAVGISAGVAALISAVPVLQPYILDLCLLVLALITLVNLRGTVEAGMAFALPTYLFVLSLGTVLVIGLVKSLLSGGRPEPVEPPPALPVAVEGVSLWLLLRAFASGCTAMTGVEAVSNGVSAFKEPVVRTAQRTLSVIVALLAVLLGGIAYLAWAYNVGAMDQEAPGFQSVLSQLTAAAIGRGPLYFLTMASILAVLSLSANTSFVDFPRLCRLLARDDFLPRAFAVMGRRLVYSAGILFLAGASGLLLTVFGGITDRLIPLFAVGAFLAFTLSQAGMVAHWRKALRGRDHTWTRGRRAHARAALVINGVGATATAAALAVILAAKFIEGAWMTVLAVPALLALFHGIKRHYERVAKQVATRQSLDLRDTRPPVVVLPAECWNRLTRQALRFGMRLSPDVIAVHLSALSGEPDDGEERSLRDKWRREVEEPARAAGVAPPRLEMVYSPYRKFVDPLLEYIEHVHSEFPGREVAVIIPELIKRHWWQLLLHNHRARQLRRALLQQGGRRLVVISIPWPLEDPSGRLTPSQPTTMEKKHGLPSLTLPPRTLRRPGRLPGDTC
jgi:amino acid transporter